MIAIPSPPIQQQIESGDLIDFRTYWSAYPSKCLTRWWFHLIRTYKIDNHLTSRAAGLIKLCCDIGAIYASSARKVVRILLAL